MSFLYRGVSNEMHQKNNGRLIPFGNKVETVMNRNDRDLGLDLRRDNTFTRDFSEVNTVRGHQLASGIHEGCFISTTEKFQIALRFATKNGTTDGLVYVLDQSKFQALGILARKFPDPRYPDEEEVSIRSQDAKEIPLEAVVEVKSVCASDFHLGAI